MVPTRETFTPCSQTGGVPERMPRHPLGPHDAQYDAAVPYDTNAPRSMSSVSSFVAACMLSRTCPLRVVAVTPWLCSYAVR